MFVAPVHKKIKLKIKQISSPLNLPICGKVFKLFVFDRIFQYLLANIMLNSN